MKCFDINVITPKQTNTESSSFYREKMLKVYIFYFDYCNLFIIKNQFSSI